MSSKLVINGFSFETSDAYNEAQKEAEAVSYLTAKTDFNNTANTVKLYNKLIDKQTFVTPVGISFLKELYENIINSGIIAKENLRPIPVKLIINKQSTSVKGFTQEEESKIKFRLSYTENKLRNARVMNAFFVVIIIVLFAITMLGDKSPLIDAEVKLQDKYAGWEESLNERERIITEKENELGIK